MSAVTSILETFDPVFNKISTKQKKDKKEKKKNRRDRKEEKERGDFLQNQQGRTLLGRSGGAFTGRPESTATILG